jgi:hypothetical protein
MAQKNDKQHQHQQHDHLEHGNPGEQHDHKGKGSCKCPPGKCTCEDCCKDAKAGEHMQMSTWCVYVQRLLEVNGIVHLVLLVVHSAVFRESREDA